LGWLGLIINRCYWIMLRHYPFSTKLLHSLLTPTIPTKGRIQYVMDFFVITHRTLDTSVTSYLASIRDGFLNAKPVLHLFEERIYILEDFLFVPLRWLTNSELLLLKNILQSGELKMKDTIFDIFETDTLYFESMPVNRGTLWRQCLESVAAIFELTSKDPRVAWHINRLIAIQN